MALQTTVEQVEGPTPVTVVALDGELDGATYEGVIDTIRGLYAAGTRKLLLDLSDLSFISSSGLVAIHSAMRLMRGGGREGGRGPARHGAGLGGAPRDPRRGRRRSLAPEPPAVRDAGRRAEGA